jgi:hypothetical protein
MPRSGRTASRHALVCAAGHTDHSPANLGFTAPPLALHACQTPDMADFEVAYSNDVLTPYSGDAARYEINPQSGVLTVFDGDGQRFHYSPTGWLSVRDEAPVSVYGTHAKGAG